MSPSMPPSEPSAAPWVVLGAGYTGSALVRALAARGTSVVATRRTAEPLAALAALPGVTTRIADLADPPSLAGWIPRGAVIVCCAPPGADPAGEIAALLAAATAAGAARLLYVSSTGVYAPAAGAWVDESWPVAPTTPSGHARVAAEAAVAAGALPWAILRPAGIHGPGRELRDRIRAGSHRIIGDGTTFVSRIHVDDLVAALLAAGDRGATGAFNIADDSPAPLGPLADAIADEEGVPRSPRVPVDQVAPEIAAMLTANRRIANGRMVRELGVSAPARAR